MNDFKDKTYAVLEFATIDGFYDKAHATTVSPSRDVIIEVAAVRIAKGRIDGHFHSFIAIDGYDAREVEFEPHRFSAYHVDAEHLIGAPSFKEVAERLQTYLKDSVLIAAPSYFARKHFSEFAEKAKSTGILFNQPVFDMGDFYAAANLKNAVRDSGQKFEDLSVLRLGQMMKDCDTWTEIFAEYDVYFDPDSDEAELRGRNDPLGWALAFAKFFVALNTYDDEDDGNDEENPF